ncbi:hypothetical protein [Enterococcus faecalis]|uniref:hypothetical protein n=1 Tax=Enterococcus faecalis TaxID=1351 RepID=UPI00404168FB
MFKKSKTICFFAMLALALFPFISTGSSVYASESYNQKVNEIEKSSRQSTEENGKYDTC